MTRLDTLLLVMAVVVLAMGVVVSVMMWQSSRRRELLRRPFMVFNEPTLYPEDEPALRLNGSYPSGHTLLGWSSALLMMEINPDRATEIMARGIVIEGNTKVVRK